MSDLSRLLTNLPPEQRAIQDKCFHPTGTFVEFKREDIEQSIPERFEQMVAKYPERIAVKTRNHQLSYDALNKAANRVARAILAQRGGEEEPIALLLEHDAPMIVAILGVLKAGKIYVPLDPSHPRSRITYTLDDSQAGLIVTNNLNLSLAGELAGNTRRLINIDIISSDVSDKNPDLSLSPDTFSFIMYTSGSTGQPKGVVQNHRNILYAIMNYTNGLHICGDDRLTLLHSCSFATSLNNHFGALLNGAAVLPFDLKREGATQLADWLIKEQITMYHSVPTVFHQLTRHLTGVEEFPKLRVVHLSGEPVTRSDVDLYKKHFSSQCILIHRMGIRETGTVAGCFIDKTTSITGAGAPLGYASEGMEILLLDEAGAKVGCDQIGEITVKSRYFPLGYWRRPELTRAAFLPDPEGGDERIYRTGDMGRMSADGCLFHLGRKDFQVKIRGHRIEVGEIEVALMALENIKEAAVVSRQGESELEESYLVAYIVPTEKLSLSITMLRRALGEKLPDYMVPSTFVFLDALPLTATGKVDRRALPTPNQSRPELESEFVAPRNPTEETLARIWAEVLKVERVGVHDNFFELGGHSLSVTQVISRARESLQVDLPVRSLFENPTVGELAAQIVAVEAQKIIPDKMTAVLAELESLSDDEAERLLARESSTKD